MNYMLLTLKHNCSYEAGAILAFIRQRIEAMENPYIKYDFGEFDKWCSWEKFKSQVLKLLNK